MTEIRHVMYVSVASGDNLVMYLYVPHGNLTGRFLMSDGNKDFCKQYQSQHEPK